MKSPRVKNLNRVNPLPETLPHLALHHHRKKQLLKVRTLSRICRNALPLCIAKAKTRRPDLSTIEVSMVSDARIARVHKDFMNVKGATDVITFPYGEIIVSVDTAEREAKKQKWSTETELALYVIHGMLHLYGWEDQSITEASAMSQCQETILKSVLSSR